MRVLHIIAKYLFQICGYEEPVDFLVQIVYKMAYGDGNTTFEPMNLEPVNGYQKAYTVVVIDQ